MHQPRFQDSPDLGCERRREAASPSRWSLGTTPPPCPLASRENRHLKAEKQTNEFRQAGEGSQTNKQREVQKITKSNKPTNQAEQMNKVKPGNYVNNQRQGNR